MGNNPVCYRDPDGREISKAIAILKNSNSLSENTKSVISEKMINKLYKAEAKRMNILEKLGIDGSTIGRGQLGQDAYDDVMIVFSEEIKDYCKQLGIKLSNDFKQDMKNCDVEDFIVSAYLSLCIERRQTEGRSSEDAAKFGIGFYHGASKMIKNAQLKHSDIVSFSGTEASLKNGTKKEQDLLNYINEVYCEEK